MPINKNKLEKFCKDYSKISIDFALGNCSATIAGLKQEKLKEEFLAQNQPFYKRLFSFLKDLMVVYDTKAYVVFITFSILMFLFLLTK